MATEIEQRFESKFQVSEGCWVWSSTTDRSGYGRFSVGGRLLHASRVSWELYRGEIPAGMEIDHLCRNRLCVNPAHLEPVTHDENQARRVGMKPPKPFCKNGHPLTPENIYVYPKSGHRACRECNRAAHRQRST